MKLVCDNKRFGLVKPECNDNLPSKTMDINYNQCTVQFFVCKTCAKHMAVDALKFGHTGTVRSGVDMVAYMTREKEHVG